MPTILGAEDEELQTLQGGRSLDADRGSPSWIPKKRPWLCICRRVAYVNVSPNSTQKGLADEKGTEGDCLAAARKVCQRAGPSKTWLALPRCLGAPQNLGAAKAAKTCWQWSQGILAVMEDNAQVLCSKQGLVVLAVLLQRSDPDPRAGFISLAHFQGTMRSYQSRAGYGYLLKGAYDRFEAEARKHGDRFKEQFFRWAFHIEAATTWPVCKNYEEGRHVLLIMPSIHDFGGKGNPWHRLANIYPYWMSLVFLQARGSDVTLFWRDRQTYLLATGAPHQKQLDILGQKHLWPTAVKDLCGFSELVVPFHGGFLWDLAWDADFQCARPEFSLMQQFVSDFVGLNAGTAPSTGSAMEVCFLNRTEHRILANHQQILEQLGRCTAGNKFLDVRVLSFSWSDTWGEQMSNVSSCDVLLGVHGAGLSHLLWLGSEAVVIELLPAVSGNVSAYAYYRNLAKLTGIEYIPLPAEAHPPENATFVNVSVSSLLNAVTAAAYRISNRGSRRWTSAPVCF
ncbi:unnamed protein product [Durusdinium trenchii]|uniref:Glycosyltransferase 61 catalytic domain-containing protein n=1 Tax=Durusdinium trenchii TaxID=1381693 RepID=A0ABP0S7U1_9DINO